VNNPSPQIQSVILGPAARASGGAVAGGRPPAAAVTDSITLAAGHRPAMDPLVVEAGEADVDELLDVLESGRRVRLRTEFLGSDHEGTLRYGGTWYCDTPTRLHRHDSREEMRHCLEEQGYARE